MFVLIKDTKVINQIKQKQQLLQTQYTKNATKHTKAPENSNPKRPHLKRDTATEQWRAHEEPQIIALPAYSYTDPRKKSYSI